MQLATMFPQLEFKFEFLLKEQSEHWNTESIQRGITFVTTSVTFILFFFSKIHAITSGMSSSYVDKQFISI
jgi:hypothetical protein